eukprot:1190261-Prorocentrum_minimum.AAC.4
MARIEAPALSSIFAYSTVFSTSSYLRICRPIVQNVPRHPGAPSPRGIRRRRGAATRKPVALYNFFIKCFPARFAGCSTNGRRKFVSQHRLL